MINRRDFLALSALFTGALVTLPYIRIKEQMELSDVWAKLANQARLTSEELDFLRLQGRETQQRNAFVAGNTTPQGTLLTTQTLTPFYSTVLTIDTVSITIEIPGGFKHIFITGSGRLSDNGVGIDFINTIFNGDTGANYKTTALLQVDSTVSSSNVTGSNCKLGLIPTDPSTSGYCGSFFSYIYNYNSAFYKQCASYTVADNGTHTYLSTIQGNWINTSKINSITISADLGKMQAGTTISVYGLS